MQHEIKIEGANVHNLKNVDLVLPRNQFIVFTGLSGSGKSSLAFDTIYAEGQRRYMESLSAYARQFLDKMDKPNVRRIEGLSPAISIDQKSASHNPRSTVGTITEIYDYFRLLYSSIGQPHCYNCGRKVQNQSIQEMTDVLFTWPEDTSILVMAPLVSEKKGEFKSVFESLIKEGFSRIKVDGTLYALSEAPELDKKKKHSLYLVVDRLKINEENRSRLFQSIETASKQSKGLVLIESVATENQKAPEKSHLFSEHLNCPHCQISMEELSPRLFSFNSPIGACSGCNGLGDAFDFDPELVIENPKLPTKNATSKVINLDGTFYGRAAERLAQKYNFTLKTPYNQLTDAQKNIVLYGQPEPMSENPYLTQSIEDMETSSKKWEGVINNLRRRYFQTQSEGMRFFFRSYMSAKPCEYCNGNRLKPAALHVKVAGATLPELIQKSIKDLLESLEKITFTAKEMEIAHQIIKEIKERLSFLNHVGLGYISLDRKSGTLSGGEFQRIRLATQIGAGLTGVLYVLDEPSIGLHQRDNQKLIETLFKLKDLGNTLIVVEHDEDTIKAADFVVDIGPGAGRDGGHISFSGTQKAFKTAKSLTQGYVYGKNGIKVPKTRRSPKKNQSIWIRGAKENNLQNVDVEFPLGVLHCITGVSGSGKSSLIHDVFHKALMRHFNDNKERPGKHKSIEGLEHIDKTITIDQSPIGRTPRSNPATYTGVWGPIRDLYTQTREAKIRGYKAGRFSFNVKGGRCEACEGDGVIKIEMHFLSDVYVTCDVCKGARFNTETLEVTYKGYSISDTLKMTISEASEIFETIPSIYTKLKTLEEVGLGYIQLGQNATTLSGGEAQRIKLAKELSKRSTGKTLYLLDEPTTGLHFADIEKLLHVLNKLVDAGNTVIVIEHNLDVIKTADYITDLGPEGGKFGGKIIATGTPEAISKVKNSFTGHFLKPLL